MKSEIRFGTWETVTFILSLICTQLFLSFPRIMSESAGTAGWILTAYVSVIMLIVFTIICRLYKKFNGMDIVDIGEHIGGSTVRIFVGLIYFIHLMFALVLTLREFAENMKTVALPQSPISFIIIFFSIVMVFGSYIGLESIVRFGSVIVLVIFAGYLIIIIAVSPYYEIHNILPIFGSGYNQIFIQGLNRLSIFSGFVGLFFVLPYIGNYKTFKKVGFISLTLSSIILTLGCLCYQLLFPYPSSTQSFLPIYSLSRQINFGRFFQHVEAAFLFIWAASGMLYLSTVLFLASYVLKKAFKLEYIRPLIIPLMIITFTMSLFPGNLMSTLKLETTIFRNYSWIVISVIPIALLIIAGLRKKNKKGQEIK